MSRPIDHVSLRTSRHPLASHRLLGRELLLGVAGLFSTLQPLVADGQNVIASVRSDGTQGNDLSNAPAISSDGRVVAFVSLARLDQALDTDSARDVYVHDFATGQTELVSQATNHAQDGKRSEDPAISADGRFVVFQSMTALVAADTNGKMDVYLRDRASTGTTTLISRTPAGSGGNDASRNPMITPDGRYVAFESDASNLAGPSSDTNGKSDVYVYDTVAGAMTCATCTGDGNCIAPSLSADGRYLAFISGDTNFIPNDVNQRKDVFLMDRSSGIVRCLSLHHNGNFQFTSFPVHDDGELAISADGSSVVFASALPNTVASDSNGNDPDIFLYDVATSTIGIVSLTSLQFGGAQLFGGAHFPSISADGRYVAFQSGVNFDPAHTNSDGDVFVHDRITGETHIASLTYSGGSTNADSSRASISADGRSIAFASRSNAIVAQDSNSYEDVFVRRVGSLSATAFCAGDGFTSGCPCANDSVPFANKGCRNSLGNGAELRATGVARISADDLVLIGSEMTDDSAIYFQGTAQTPGGAGIPFGDGLRCAAGALIRLGVKGNSGGSSSYPGTGDASISVRGAVTVSGTRVYHIWYRDGASFCTSATFNSTNALLVTWTL